MITLALLIFAGACKAVMDTLQFHFDTSVFRRPGSWWNPKYSWMNKWKDGDPSKGEAFPGSSTFFVWVTDAWHFFQHFMIAAIMAAIVLYTPMLSQVWDFVILYCSFTMMFELLYGWAFKSRNK